MKGSAENMDSGPLLEEAADWMDRQDELTDAERDAFRDWLAASPAHARAYDMVRHAMLDSALLEASEDVRTASAPRLLNVRLLGWAAAGLALAATILVMLFTRAPIPVPAIMPSVTQDYTTGLGQRADWRLADNSHLFLNADSKIHVEYFSAARNLSLARGEAIFEVAKDPARPFRVMAHAVTVTAVGTMFGIDIMNDAVGVRVYHGVVTVSRANRQTLTLRKGDWLTLDPQIGMKDGHFDPATYQNWRADWLEADKMPLSYVVAKLNRYTDRPIVIGDDALANTVLTGRFHLSDTNATLRLIAATLNLTPKRRGDRIYLVAQHG